MISRIQAEKSLESSPIDAMALLLTIKKHGRKGWVQAKERERESARRERERERQKREKASKARKTGLYKAGRRKTPSINGNASKERQTDEVLVLVGNVMEDRCSATVVER
jgi:hypothetical protein